MISRLKVLRNCGIINCRLVPKHGSLSTFFHTRANSTVSGTSVPESHVEGSALDEAFGLVSESPFKLDNWNKCLTTPLSEEDPALYQLIQAEQSRQWSGLELIASENFTSQAVLEIGASGLTNKYSEGLPGARYYGGNQYIDQIERLCMDRALQAFRLDKKEWGVNVQPYSGSPANFAAFTALLKPHERLMGLDLPSGGHLTHGYQTATKKISATSVYFESMPYRVHPDTGIIDYDKLEENADLFKPKLIICGHSAYPRELDYERFRKIADKVGAYLMCDMAHISGLVAGEQLKSPFEFCDIVTTTTHKSLRGPRSGIIFFRKSKYSRPDTPTDFEDRINQAVFPGLQGGPHNQAIAGVALAMHQASKPEFKQYTRQVCLNAHALADELQKLGYKLATGGTDNHLVLWDLRHLGLTGSKLETLCDLVHITVNKNAVHGDKSALSPGGVRLGTPALTSRSFGENDFRQVAGYLDRAVGLCLKAMEAAGSKKMKDFQLVLRKATHEKEMNEFDNKEALEILRKDLNKLSSDVEEFAKKFPMPGGFQVGQIF